MRLLVCTFHQQLKQDSSLHNLQKRALIIVNISKDGMALLTASRHALLNDMLQREHVRVFIGLKLDMETIPKCRMHENNNDGGKKEILTRCFFKNFLHITHTLFCSKSLPCWPCINRNRLIYALSKLPSPYPRDDKNGTLHAIFGLGCVLTGAGISLICVRIALSQQKSFGTAGESSELFIYSMLHVGLPSICADKGHSGACLDAKRVQHPQKKPGL